MAPSIEVVPPTLAQAVEPKGDSKATASGYIREPLKYSGLLDEFKSFDVTPIIRHEFPDLQLTDILNDDQKTRDLTITKHGIELIQGDRGALGNTGYDFRASHPLVRTNPVAGWKSLFSAAGQVDNGWIEGVTKRESEILKKYFRQLIAEKHDLQVRFKWRTNDLAIWDNRSVFHTATNDYKGKQQGNRVVSLGEIPYFDPASKSRREALAAEA
ncbi:hypothetical protein BDV10DRAFT_188455 [Aspergillus recurvatus]